VPEMEEFFGHDYDIKISLRNFLLHNYKTRNVVQDKMFGQKEPT